MVHELTRYNQGMVMMGRKETPLEKIANISQLLGILLITLSILGSIFPHLRIIDLEQLTSGLFLGVLFAWVIPFWIRKVIAGKLW